MAKAGVLVLPVVIENCGGFLTGENVVTYLVVFGDFCGFHEFVWSDRDGLYRLAELDEILDCPHIVPAGNGLHVGQSPFLKPNNLIAVNIIHIVYPAIEVFEEPFEDRVVVIVGLVRNVRLLLFEVVMLGVSRRCWFYPHCPVYGHRQRRVRRMTRR